jgi:hypothetical protein
VFANFGIAIAAKMPMITTTINNSISVKPFRFCDICALLGVVIGDFTVAGGTVVLGPLLATNGPMSLVSYKTL